MSSNKIDNRVIATVGFIAILALIAKPVWDGRFQWLFGQGYDDGIYVATAKSLAVGEGYRHVNLPGAPVATKYPPLYPLYLAMAWRIRPAFPDTLEVASIAQDALLPVYLAILLVVLRQLGLSWRRTFFVAAMTFVTITFVFLTVRLFSELLFGCFLLGSIMAIEKSVRENSSRWAALGGFLTGMAYLTRVATVPLLLAVPIFLYLRKRSRLNVFYFAIALPMIASWHVWGMLHTSSVGKLPYFTEYLNSVNFKEFGMHLLTQMANLSAAVANDFIPGITDFMKGIPLHHPIIIAAIAGCVRVGRRQQWPLAIIFTGLYLTMILLWWFHGIDRLMEPVWPILLVGIAAEVSHFADLCAHTIKRPAMKQVPRWVLIGLAPLLILRNDAALWHKAANEYAVGREQRIADRGPYGWIRSNAPSDAVLLTWKDTVSYLYTGIPSSHELFVAIIPQSQDVPQPRTVFVENAQSKRGFLMLLASDFAPGNEFLMTPFRGTVEAVPGAKLEYSDKGGAVYSLPIP
jgi:hypothetical protein